ncbi:hypothetical protein [Streptomyces sp. NPDC096033]|uniref:hypothetical protein n=1 Tax=Streptomyces sp. NPDC096033 TaxID=3366071 RepID=UPI0037FA337A
MSGIQLKLPTGYAITLQQRRLRAAEVRADRRHKANAKQWLQVAADFFGGIQ